MARAEAASASARSDSIKGLAQSIAKPAYRRLLTAEPALRRAVPALIIAFLVTICVGAGVQVLDHQRQSLGDIEAAIEAAAELIAARIDSTPAADNADLARKIQSTLQRAIPSWAIASGRSVLITDGAGKIIAALPGGTGMLGRNLIDVLGRSQPLTTFGAGA